MQYAIEIGSNCNFQVHILKQNVVNLYDICVQNFLKDLTVKEFCKSVNICRSYDQKSNVLFFSDMVYL